MDVGHGVPGSTLDCGLPLSTIAFGSPSPTCHARVQVASTTVINCIDTHVESAVKVSTSSLLCCQTALYETSSVVTLLLASSLLRRVKLCLLLVKTSSCRGSWPLLSCQSHLRAPDSAVDMSLLQRLLIGYSLNHASLT